MKVPPPDTGSGSGTFRRDATRCVEDAARRFPAVFGRKAAALPRGTRAGCGNRGETACGEEGSAILAGGVNGIWCPLLVCPVQGAIPIGASELASVKTGMCNLLELVRP